MSLDLGLIVRASKVLSYPLRIHILMELAQQPLTHTDLCERTHKPLGVWTHLQQMVASDLIKRIEDEDGRYVVYGINKEVMAHYIEELAQLVELS